MWQVNKTLLSSYFDGSSISNPSLKNWTPSKSTPDNEIKSAGTLISSRAWDLKRNDSTTNSIVDTFTTGVVGTGIKAHPKIDADMIGISKEEARVFEKKARTLFNIWAKSLKCDSSMGGNFYSLQTRMLINCIVSGDAYALRKYIDRGSVADLTIAGIESERVKTPIESTIFNSDKIVNGIEIDDNGAPYRYFFRRTNKLLSYEYDDVRAFDSEGRPNVFHLFFPDQFNQRTGVSWLNKIMEPLKQLKRYDEAEISAAVISAFFTVFVKTKTGEGLDLNSGVSLPGGQMSSRQTPQRDYSLGKGSIVDLAENEDVEIANPNRPNPNYADFKQSVLKSISSSLGLPVDVVTKSYDKSYAASRAGLLDAYKKFKVLRSSIDSMFNQPIYNLLIEEFVLSGLLDAPGFSDDNLKKELYCKCDWIGDSLGMIQPLQEARALSEMIGNGLKSRTELKLENDGGDYYSTLDEIEEELRIQKEKGVVEDEV